MPVNKLGSARIYKLNDGLLSKSSGNWLPTAIAALTGVDGLVATLRLTLSSL